MSKNVRQHVVNTALKMIGNKAIHCWDHIMRIYAAAGVVEFWGYPGNFQPCYKRSTKGKNCATRKTYSYGCKSNCFNGSQRYWTGARKKYDNQTRMRPEAFAPDSVYDQIGPGDWLWIYNKNTADPFGGHSVMFIEWVDKVKREAVVVSGGARRGLRKHRSNFYRDPVTWGERPVKISKNLKFSTSW